MKQEFYKIELDGNHLMVSLKGRLTLENVGKIETKICKEFAKLVAKAKPDFKLSIIGDESLRVDTSTILVVKKLIAKGKAKNKGLLVSFQNMPEEYTSLEKKLADYDCNPNVVKKSHLRTPLDAIEGLGKTGERIFLAFAETPNLIGMFLLGFIDMLIKPTKFRFTAMVYHIQSMTLPAILIVATVNFMVGAVLTEQAAVRLPGFGSEALIVGFIGMVQVSEISVLLAGMMVAGRSSSAITAEIGSMRINEEIDAMKVMGLDTMRYLVMPRAVAMIVSLPILTFIAMIFGLAGSAILLNLRYGMPIEIFIERAYDGVNLKDIASAMVKTPFISIMLVMVACSEGMKVKSTAASLGHHTTVSVVKSLFIVIIIDAIIAIYFTQVFGSRVAL